MRDDALKFLHENYTMFPTEVPGDKYMSESIYKNWRFVKLIEGMIVFANCIDLPIEPIDLIYYRARVTQ